MNDLDEAQILGGAGGSTVRLHTLIILRWLAIVGQSITVIVAAFVFDLQISLGLCGLAIGVSVISNLVASIVYPQSTRLPERDIIWALLFDLLQLAFLLYLTGGLNNPFSLLMLAPVTVSAMTLRPGATLLLCGLAVVLVSILAFFYVPLRTGAGEFMRMPQLFIYGFWIALMIGIGFLAMYAGRVTRETRSMSQALLATQMALAREQKLTDLGGVVAAAAHELGTPLATIKLTSAELMDELRDKPELLEDAELIRTQADRCRDILRSMGRAGKEDLHLRTAPLEAVVQDAADPHLDRGKHVQFGFKPYENGLDQMPNVLRKPEILHGLRNLIQNAVDFADTNVWIDARWDDDKILVRVVDDGPGYPIDLLGRIGDPFLRRRREPHKRKRAGYEGMGLGLFIAKTLLERSGAEMSFANGSGQTPSADTPVQRRGAIAEVIWPASRIIAPATGQSTALGENKPIEI